MKVKSIHYVEIPRDELLTILLRHLGNHNFVLADIENVKISVDDELSLTLSWETKEDRI